jgi:threonine/homoserine efflux transporter RhtA
VAVVLIAAHQTRGRADFLAVLIPLTALEPVLLLIFHQNLWQVVLVVDVSMALIACALGALYIVQERIEISKSALAAANASATTSLALVRSE